MTSRSLKPRRTPRIRVRLSTEDDQVLASSRDVARHFDKNHYHVLRDIDDIKEMMGGIHNWIDPFYETTYVHEQNQQKYRQYLMTRDGFNLLVMGFTGERATRFKWSYINKFNEMEEELKKKQQMKLPSNYKESLIQLLEQVEENEKLNDKLDYFENYLENKNTIPISVIAENYGMTATNMNKLLNGLGIQYKQGGTWMLYAKYKGLGYTHIETKGSYEPVMKWLPRGQQFLYEKLKSVGVIPTVEKE